MIQVLVPARVWGFESPLSHHFSDLVDSSKSRDSVLLEACGLAAPPSVHSSWPPPSDEA